MGGKSERGSHNVQIKWQSCFSLLCTEHGVSTTFYSHLERLEHTWIRPLRQDWAKILNVLVQATTTRPSPCQTTGPSTRPSPSSSGRLITLHKYIKILTLDQVECFITSICFLFYRKNILRFLDPERDISILKGTLKPGDVIHYVFDRHSTTNISENLYRLLPTVSPMKNQHHRRCAIVGNSGILLNSSCGTEIDSHDFVIRYPPHSQVPSLPAEINIINLQVKMIIKMDLHISFSFRFITLQLGYNLFPVSFNSGSESVLTQLEIYLCHF